MFAYLHPRRPGARLDRIKNYPASPISRTVLATSAMNGAGAPAEFFTINIGVGSVFSETVLLAPGGRSLDRPARAVGTSWSPRRLRERDRAQWVFPPLRPVLRHPDWRRAATKRIPKETRFISRGCFNPTRRTAFISPRVSFRRAPRARILVRLSSIDPTRTTDSSVYHGSIA